jgi:hypothetical protein
MRRSSIIHLALALLPFLAGTGTAEAQRSTTISGRTAPPHPRTLYSNPNARAHYRSIGATHHANAQDRYHKRPSKPSYIGKRVASAAQRARAEQLARRGDMRRMLFEGHNKSFVTVKGNLPIEIGYTWKLFQKPNIKPAKVELKIDKKFQIKGKFAIGKQTIELVGEMNATSRNFSARAADGSMSLHGSVSDVGVFKFTKLKGAVPGKDASNKQNLMHLQTNRHKPGAGRYADYEVGVPSPHVPLPQ